MNFENWDIDSDEKGDNVDIQNIDEIIQKVLMKELTMLLPIKR